MLPYPLEGRVCGPRRCPEVRGWFCSCLGINRLVSCVLSEAGSFQRGGWGEALSACILHGNITI